VKHAAAELGDDEKRIDLLNLVIGLRLNSRDGVHIPTTKKKIVPQPQSCLNPLILTNKRINDVKQYWRWNYNKED
jgi:hypothetical protein